MSLQYRGKISVLGRECVGNSRYKKFAAQNINYFSWDIQRRPYLDVIVVQIGYDCFLNEQNFSIYPYKKHKFGVNVSLAPESNNMEKVSHWANPDPASEMMQIHLDPDPDP
jgi:hypothetical protein